MSDKFPPKNSGFRLETFRFPSDVVPLDPDRLDRILAKLDAQGHAKAERVNGPVCYACDEWWPCPVSVLVAAAREAIALRAEVRHVRDAALVPEGVVTLNGKRWRVVRFTSDSGGKDARLVPYRPENTNG